ncbi:DUF368 domain-containing protein [Brachyspira murdochii]|uniref:Integral membrane protein n=2 Tax=Brachyspira murdochii TaxID=84378 RepID=D5U8G4_BRAM5|nr:DUF368 domain-containing protein [Brachyspira murdochii]ADG70987.1 protein of unknown function DUF368 [Brachyspira murdochii DSM 12563]PPS22799.1 hypothetical protein DJ52_02665 [Brachyspira murdochii]
MKFLGFMNYIYTVIKGFIIGASMLVPGFSGGTMAMILGIYDKLISSLSGILTFSKNENYLIKNKFNFLFLIFFCAGSLLGMVIISKPLSNLIDKYYTVSAFFFMGAALGGFNTVYNKTKAYKFNFVSIIYILLGAAIVYLISIIPEGFFSSSSDRSEVFMYFILIIAGLIVAIAMILPGISVSYMFLLLGIYQETIDALHNLYFPYLIPLAIGAILGVVLTTKILEYWMEHYVKASYLIISGFVLGSIIQVFPGLPKGIEWALCPIMFLAAYFLIRLLQRFDPDNR